MHSPTALPEKIIFTGYTGVFDELDVMLLFKNSVFLAGSITVLNTIFRALAAYTFAKIPFPGRDKIFSFMLLTMMIPSVLFLIPTYVLMYRIGWVGHFEALIVPSIVSVFNILLIRQFMSGIPDELVIFLRVILPLARPALATVAILTFMGSWNDFFGPCSISIGPNNGHCNGVCYNFVERYRVKMPSKFGCSLRLSPCRLW